MLSLTYNQLYRGAAYIMVVEITPVDSPDNAGEKYNSKRNIQ